MIAIITRLFLNKGTLIGILCVLFVLGSYYLGYSSAEKDYQETVIKSLKESAKNESLKKDETINQLLHENTALKSNVRNLDKSLGRLQQSVSSKATTRNNNTKDPTGIALQRCREFHIEGSELLREAIERYQRESQRVDALNTLIKSK